MLSIIVSVIFFGAMLLQVFIFFKMYKLISQLKEKNVSLSKWSGYAAKRGLRNIINADRDDYTTTKAIELLGYFKKRNRLFFGSIGLIFLIFFLTEFLS